MVKAKFPIQGDNDFGGPTELNDDLITAVANVPGSSFIKVDSRNVPGWCDVIIEGPDRDTVIKVIAGFFSVYEWAVGEGGTFDIQIEWV
jgi:hypothetical protein